MRKVDYKDWIPFGKGAEATTYQNKANEGIILRMLPRDSEEKVRQEFERCKRVADLGVKTPAVYELVTDGKNFGYTGQLIKGKKSVCRAIADAPERIPELAKMFADRVVELHKTECDTTQFPYVYDKTVKMIQESPVLSQDSKIKALEMMKAIPVKTTCVHGDLHMGNLIITDDEQYWIDLGNFAYGNPAVEFARMSLSCYLPEFFIKLLFHISKAQFQEFNRLYQEEYLKICGHKEELLAILPQVKFVSLHAALFSKVSALFFIPELQKLRGERPDNTLIIVFKLLLGIRF